MAERNPNKLYDRIKTIKSSLESILSTVDSIHGEVKELMTDADFFGGVISKVFKEQMSKYFIAELDKISGPVRNLSEGDRVPGSLKDLVIFLDSVPLAMIREEPSISELAAPEVSPSVELKSPAQAAQDIKGKVSNDVDELPQNASFANGAEKVEESRKIKEYIDFGTDEGQESWRSSEKGKMEGDWWKNHCHAETVNRFKDDGNPAFSKIDASLSMKKLGKIYVNEETDTPIDYNYASSLLKTWGEPHGSRMEESRNEGLEIFRVMRTSSTGSSLGEDVANLEPKVVKEFSTKKEAEEFADHLNSTILPDEKRLLGTEYKVDRRVIEEGSMV